jgi:prepilin-type processing-associated H-X9-DG protein
MSLRDRTVQFPKGITFSADFEYRKFGNRVFNYMYWHHKSELGYGNVLFVDFHVGYEQAKPIPDFQQGPNWSFIWND